MASLRRSLLLVALLWRARPDELTARDALRLLPDVLRLVRRLAADRTLPRGVRLRLWLLLAYLLSPIDLVPDFIPVFGQIDDALLVPLGILVATRLMPPEVLEELRGRATVLAATPTDWRIGAAVIVFWVLAAALAARWVISVLTR